MCELYDIYLERYYDSLSLEKVHLLMVDDDFIDDDLADFDEVVLADDDLADFDDDLVDEVALEIRSKL